MLKELNASNFKSWQEIERMRLAPITGLFGTNSSGKTSILQLLLMLKQTIESPDRAQVLDFGDERSLANLGSYRDAVFAHDEGRELAFSISWQLPAKLGVKDPTQSERASLFVATELKFGVTLKKSTTGRVQTTRMCYSSGAHRFTMQLKNASGSKYELVADSDKVNFQRFRGRAWDLPGPVKFYGFPDQVYAYFKNAGFLGDLQLAFEKLFARVHYLGPLREHPRRDYRWTGAEPADMGLRGERVVDALLAAKKHGRKISLGKGRKRQTIEERVAFWLKELQLIHEFSVDPISEESKLYHVHVRKSPHSPKVLITDVGFGVSQILPVLTLCYYVPEGSTLLLEQPEIHLHPSAQMGLADVLIDAVKHRKVQIILESHSEHLLTRLQRRIAEQVIEPDDAALYFCDVSNAGSELVGLDVDLFGMIHNWPKDFFGDPVGEMASINRAALERKRRRKD